MITLSEYGVLSGDEVGEFFVELDVESCLFSNFCFSSIVAWLENSIEKLLDRGKKIKNNNAKNSFIK
ncbi:MAG: hypothetical protein QM479_05470 [Pseudomonadota bacterium]